MVYLLSVFVQFHIFTVKEGASPVLKSPVLVRHHIIDYACSLNSINLQMCHTKYENFVSIGAFAKQQYVNKCTNMQCSMLKQYFLEGTKIIALQ